MNRSFRRLQQFGTDFAARRSGGLMSATTGKLFAARTPPEVTSVRAKSSGHGKKTADKWNQ